MKNQASPYVEVKAVTWCKDSHGLFDYESQNVTFTKSKVESSSRVYKEEGDITIRNITKFRAMPEESASKDPNYVFSIMADKEKSGDSFYFQFDKRQICEEGHNNKLFLVVRSLKNEDGTQKGYNLELGDVIRLGRIEYRVIEYQNHNLEVSSLLLDSKPTEFCPFNVSVKDCNDKSQNKKQCRICLMDEQDVPELLVNPCNCKGTSEYVHIQCLQDWISSKLKKKINSDATCFYWKKLNCEVCKIPLPDLVEVEDSKKELIPIYRPEGPYILLERVFYDRTKENADNAKMMILLNISNETQEIKLGRGHECDLRENDISVSRLHAFIKYQDGHFTITDNNSKFGTLVLLRKNLKIEKNKKVAVQFGRTVTTLSLKQASNTISTYRNPMLMEKLTRWQSPKTKFHIQLKPTVIGYNRPKNMVIGTRIETQPSDLNLNGSFLD